MAIVVENNKCGSALLDSVVRALREVLIHNQSFTSGSTSLFLPSGSRACLLYLLEYQNPIFENPD